MRSLQLTTEAEWEAPTDARYVPDHLEMLGDNAKWTSSSKLHAEESAPDIRNSGTVAAAGNNASISTQI